MANLTVQNSHEKRGPMSPEHFGHLKCVKLPNFSFTAQAPQMSRRHSWHCPTRSKKRSAYPKTLCSDFPLSALTFPHFEHCDSAEAGLPGGVRLSLAKPFAAQTGLLFTGKSWLPARLGLTSFFNHPMRPLRWQFRQIREFQPI